MHILVPTALAAVALALGACGGADDRLTREEFIARTDARCKVSNARTKGLNEQASRAAASAAGDEELLRALAPILQRASGQARANAAALRAADPPAADAAEVKRIRGLYDEQAEIVRMLAAASKRGAVGRFKALSEQQKDVVRRAREAARAYGFKECGSARSDAA